MTKYTPIIIKFISPVVVEGQELPQQYLEPLKLAIYSPQTKLLSAEQALPLPTVVTVPFEKELRMKLLPSAVYNPHGRYKVKVYQGKNNVPLYEMDWVVPQIPEQKFVDVTHSETGRDYLNLAFSEIISISHEGVWEVEDQHIVWVQDRPVIGSSYRVKYQPAVTLGDLIVSNP
ncbi:hypothetical protein OsccyDRAFT_0704 [Leptolyngbyaceae cyanobacterium JSC-12]|nr:hypothetical protein OsccyDRAFT_0704 [Leptolyngbyaceae cyanobacterium JSC-12]